MRERKKASFSLRKSLKHFQKQKTTSVKIVDAAPSEKKSIKISLNPSANIPLALLCNLFKLRPNQLRLSAPTRKMALPCPIKKINVI